MDSVVAKKPGSTLGDGWAVCPSPGRILGMSGLRTEALQRAQFYLVLIYPLVNLFLCILFAGDNMTITSLLACALFVVLGLAGRRYEVTAIVVLMALLIVVDVSVIREITVTDYSSCLMYAMSVLVFLSASSRYFDLIEFKRFVNNQKLAFLTIQAIFLLALGAYVSVYGLRSGWSTLVLQGPYNYPHTLSYLLLMFVMLDMHYVLRHGSIIAFLFLAVSEAAIVLTAVRTTLVASMMVFVFAGYELFRGRKWGLLIGAAALCGLGLYIALRLGLMQSLAAKTELALTNSTITNGRETIAFSSLAALGQGFQGVVNSVSGIGMSALLDANLENLSAAIHAHNDFIDILVCYGIFSLLIYVYAFYQFGRKWLIWAALTLGFLAFANGLFPYIDCLPMIVFARLLFDGEEIIDCGDAFGEALQASSERIKLLH